MTEAEIGVSQTLSILAESSAMLAAFLGAVGIFRLHALFDRRRDVEIEVRACMMRLTKKDTFVLPLEGVHAMMDEEQMRVMRHPGHRELLTAAIAADRRRRDLQPVLYRTRLSMLLLESVNLAVIAACIIGLTRIKMVAGAAWLSPVLWTAVIGQMTIPLWCVWIWTAETASED